MGDKFWSGGGFSEKQKDGTRVEEAHHAITQRGYAIVYPSVFGFSSNSTLVKECNKATCDWWTHPENKCLKKKPFLKNVKKCMKTSTFFQEKVIQTMLVRNAPLPKTRKLARKHN